MEKIESFLDDYSWLLKSGIYIALILWAFHGYNGIKYLSKISNSETDKNDITQMTEDERKSFIDARKKLSVFCEELVAEARHKNQTEEGYTPQNYIDDKKRIRIKNSEIYPKPIEGIFDVSIELFSLTHENRHPTQKEFIDVNNDYKKWLKETNYPKTREDLMLLKEDEPLEPIDWKSFFHHIANWALSCYLRGMLLVFFLYLIRMSGVFSKGILKTILADKTKLILAVFCWPYFLMKYPTNVIREIVVEVELRRIGNLFRKIAPEERELIRKIAASSTFWKWVKEYRSSNMHVFERSFAVALVAVILIHVVPPSLAQADDAGDCDLSRDGPQIILVVSAPDCDTADDNVVNYYFKDVTLPILSPELFQSFVTIKNFFWLKIFLSKDVYEKIFHVPIYGCLFANPYTILRK